MSVMTSPKSSSILKVSAFPVGAEAFAGWSTRATVPAPSTKNETPISRDLRMVEALGLQYVFSKTPNRRWRRVYKGLRRGPQCAFQPRGRIDGRAVLAHLEIERGRLTGRTH